MKRFFKKIMLGSQHEQEAPTKGALRKRVNNIHSIWHNHETSDVGLERIIRLLLAASQFLFLGSYIKEIAGRKGQSVQDVAIDLFVLLKLVFPVLLIYFGYTKNPFLYYLMLWFFAETMLYIPTLIFASDHFTRPRSYRRSMLLLLFNYFEITFCFAVLYANLNCLNKPFTHWFDPIYFSIVTTSTIGYGEFYPITPLGKFFVSVQSGIFFVFVVIFLNFFSNKVEQKGYFDHTNHE
jgi:hypothetical protein